MLSKLDILVSHPKWKSEIGKYEQFAFMCDLITTILGTGDKRTIAFWIGNEKRSWIKGSDILVGHNETLRYKHTYSAVYEWQDGFLQRHGYVETQNKQPSKESRREGMFFKILKGI